jgi:hypothetical protein
MPRPWLALLASLVPWMQAGGLQDTAAPLESGLVRAVELAPPAGTEVEYFRLDAGPAAGDELPQALLRYVTGPDPAGGLRVELELQYLAEGLRVIHGERALRGEQRLVFREVGERSGRTLFLQGTPDSGYEGYELGGPTLVRHAFPPGGELPLLLIDSARRGLPPPAEGRVLDPLGARFEPVRLSFRGGAPGIPSDEERTLEARRSDGSLCWRVGFRGNSCTEWRWHEGGPVARAISREEYEDARSRHELSERAAQEAAAEARRRPAVQR